MKVPAIQLPQAVCAVIEQLESCGHTAWAVGGCVRDSLRGVRPNDWDLTTSATPEQVQKIFPNVRLTGLQHGTITVLQAGMALEVTTYRGESTYTDGRHPDSVCFLSRVEDDLARRDFTINAMAYHPERGLCDPFGGQTDLQNGVLRAVGDADVRFAEDALRILRGVRFVGKTGFQIEEQTTDAMYRQMYRLEMVAAERVFAELDALLTSRYVGRALRRYRAVLAVVLPEAAPMFGLCQHNPHHRYDVWEHTVRAVEAVPAQSCLRWVMLLHDSGKPHAYTIDDAGVGFFMGTQKSAAISAEQVMVRPIRQTHCAKRSQALFCCMTIRLVRQSGRYGAFWRSMEKRVRESCCPLKRQTAPDRTHFPFICRNCSKPSGWSIRFVHRHPA